MEDVTKGTLIPTCIFVILTVVSNMRNVVGAQNRFLDFRLSHHLLTTILSDQHFESLQVPLLLDLLLSLLFLLLDISFDGFDVAL